MDKNTTTEKLNALIIAALAALVAATDLDRIVAALGCLSIATVATNDYVTIAGFLNERGIEANTTTVGEAIDRTYTSQELRENERELSDWACHPESGMILYK